jgi:Bacterial regulatory protein, arsR family
VRSSALAAGRSVARRPLASLATDDEEPETVIDRLREQIQQRLDQLAGEADRLRKALAALDPRSPSKPASTPPARKRASAATPKAKTAPARRATEAAAGSPRRTAPGATKASVLAALSGGEAMTAGEVAKKTGLVPATVSTTLSKLAKSGEVQKAQRGYRLAPPASPAPSSPAK